MTPASRLLERLEQVKRTGPTSWLARCPAHKDRTPSLSVREKEDGTVLINCFAGCGAINILETLSLQWNVLFPPSHGHCGFQRFANSSRIPARDLLEILSEEVSVVTIVAADMLANKAISDADWRRLAQAAARIGNARDHARCGPTNRQTRIRESRHAAPADPHVGLALGTAQ